MTWRDKLEIGLKEDAPFRKDNLPDSQVRGPETPTGPGRSPEIRESRGDHAAAQNGQGGVAPARAPATPAQDPRESAATSEGMPERAAVKKVAAEG